MNKEYAIIQDVLAGKTDSFRWIIEQYQAGVFNMIAGFIYDLWIKHHQMNPEVIDLTEATMASITQPKRTMSTRVCDSCLSYLIKPNDLLKGCMLVFGAVTGLLRMVFFVYYALFV